MSDCPIGDFVRIEKDLMTTAKEAGVSAASVLLSNPKTDPAAMSKGQVIVVPTHEDPLAQGGYDVYIVQDGESIGDVVRKHDVSVKEVKGLNPGLDVFSIKKGDAIVVKSDERKYRMRQGDTLMSLAKMAGCDTIDILRANEHLRPCEFKEGQSVFLPAPRGSGL